MEQCPPNSDAPETSKKQGKSFISGILKLVAGRGISLAVALVTAPIVARLFSAADFGIYGVIVAIGTWLVSFACLGYFQAIPLASTRVEMRALVRLSVLLTLILFGISLFIPWLGSDLLAGWMDSPSSQPFFWFASFLFLLNSLSSIAEYTLSREQRFGRLALYNFTTANVTRLLTIAWGVFIGAGALGLLVCNLAGLAVALIIAGITLRPVLFVSDGGSACTMKQVARQHEQFPKMQMWNWVLAATSKSFPVLILGAFFGPAVVGYFVYARNIVFSPITIFSSSVSDIFYPQGAKEWKEQRTMSRSLNRALKILIRTTVLPCFIIGALAPVLFELVFGDRWREAGVYAQILVPWLFMELVSGPTGLVFLIRKKANLALIYSVILVVVRVGSLALGGWLGGARLALILFSLSSTAVLLHQTYYCLRMMDFGLKKPIKLMAEELLFSAATTLPAALLFWFRGSSWFVLGLVVLCGGLHYLILIRREKTILHELKGFWDRVKH